MPKLIRLYIVNVLIGYGIAAAFVAMLLWFNVANLWHLVTHSSSGLLAVFVLWFANGIVFAGVQFAIAVMRLKDDDDDHQGGRRDPIRVDLTQMVPVRSEAKARDGQPRNGPTRR
ncbi:hypothetical protein TG4357_01923 [Thalassovita gelatinovora]|uniref:Uncharacterized protein n=1 Tax=Thalassovita gelatinovora TaxID=53501 RepID=A0A0P1FBV4_THAGE|nr:hypothetical protein [Thalassovita gelatinovora]QIZ80101.1 hypothetical protein HFZ77_06240 [Thalassovita gelatinovora]CUH65540.1 hypothetical protein TG4357_01923 [Thalassovita gelatinovora]SER07959.1 hypothetical protein SAMN04488043_11527 [Thalassovita gelatinovora]